VENPFPSTEMIERASGRPARERLSTNENEFGPAPEVVEAIAAAAREAHRYPDCDHFDLRTEVGTALGTDPGTVRIGSGIDGLLGQICRSFLGPGRTAVTSESTYPTFAYFARAGGAALHLAPYRDARVDWQELARLAHEVHADVVYVADPDNPTGTSLPPAGVTALADALPERTLLVLDGAYAEYQRDGTPSPAEVTARRMIWLRTFSKAYALAGMRVGYAVAAPALLSGLARGAEHYVVGRVAGAAALAALRAPGHLAEVVARTEEGRAHYTERLTLLGFTVLPSSTNFVTARCAGPGAAGRLAGALAASGVYVRHLAAPGLTDCLRISVGPARQREDVLAGIATLMEPTRQSRRPTAQTNGGCA
jgi:histidinol-phosphate aminotransferase